MSRMTTGVVGPRILSFPTHSYHYSHMAGWTNSERCGIITTRVRPWLYRIRHVGTQQSRMFTASYHRCTTYLKLTEWQSNELSTAIFSLSIFTQEHQNNLSFPSNHQQYLNQSRSLSQKWETKSKTFQANRSTSLHNFGLSKRYIVI